MIGILVAMLLALSLGAAVPAEARSPSHSPKSHSVTAPKAPTATAAADTRTAQANLAPEPPGTG